LPIKDARGEKLSNRKLGKITLCIERESGGYVNIIELDQLGNKVDSMVIDEVEMKRKLEEMKRHWEEHNYIVNIERGIGAALGKFEIFQDTAGKFRFRLKAANNKIIAVSEAYESKDACHKGIKSVMKNAPKAGILDLTG
jgi:uncharacterized protein YegP (UPF0339 family)